MTPELHAFAERHGLSADARAELAQLLQPTTAFVMLLGEGGMAEVHRVYDPILNRTVAMKVLKAELMGRSSVVARFQREAFTIARLQHPGIVPIHSFGTLPDGRPYYTMKEIHGTTLKQTLAKGDLSLRRLVELVYRVAEAVGYAHAQGVIHRDIKPENVLVGAFGEVLIVDWGLARPFEGGEVLERGSQVAEATPDLTQVGAIVGTPTYMPPEQARGGRLTPTADVYALGSVLYELLSGRTPYVGKTAWDVLMQLNIGPPPPLLSVVDHPIAVELAPVVARAMDLDPTVRYPNASALAAELGAWLEGARRREEAQALVAEADALFPSIQALRTQAQALRVEAEAMLTGLQTWEPSAKKEPAWAKEDEAQALEQQADLNAFRYTQALHAALTRAPELTDAQDRLADYYQQQHAAAELARDSSRALRAEALLATHDQRGRYRSWLAGTGAFTLHSEPPGAEVHLFRYEVQHRRNVPVPLGCVGKTPINEHVLPIGSYLIELRLPDRPAVRYPVMISRNEHWDGIAPDETTPTPVLIPAQLSDREIYIPPGWFIAGGDPLAPSSLPRRRIWLDGFLIQRFPTSIEEYLVFLNDLMEQGREEEALRYACRERAGVADDAGALILSRDSAGRFGIGVDGDGDEWRSDWPVILVNWTAARAYADWLAIRRRQPWRLPGELEREKAARGVDGRFFPWGDFLDPSWCCIRDSYPGRPIIASIYDYPTDESVYGVRSVVGNVRDLCADVWDPLGRCFEINRWTFPGYGEPGQPRVTRGGTWTLDPSRSRLASRGRIVETYRGNLQSIRLVCPFSA